jgi:CRISPR/Cas system-associated exonuclease Cas4 (RecB family)
VATIAAELSTRRLVMGPDAAARLAAAEAWLAELSPDQPALLLAASHEAADELARQVVLRHGARFGLRRLTLNRLAAQLAAPRLLAGPSASAGHPQREPLAAAGHLALTAVVARCVHLCQAAGELSYFMPVLDRPGFAPALTDTLETLRMHRVTATGSLSQAGPAAADVAALASRLDEELARFQLADRAAIYQAALQDVSEVEGLPILLLDVALSTPLEAELACALLAGAPQVLATVPQGDEVTLRALSAVLGDPTVRPCGDDSALSRLKSNLFASADPPASSLDETVTLDSFPGESRECVEIARQILQLAPRVPFDRMAVLLHAPSLYVPHLEEAFHRAGIPAWFAHGTARPHAAGRAFLALLACKAEGLSARRFAEYLSLSQVPEPGGPEPPPDWQPPHHDLLPQRTAPEPDEPPPEMSDPVPMPENASVLGGTLRAPWRWENLLVEAAVIGGLDRWQRRLDGLEQQLQLPGDEDETRAAARQRTLENLRALRDYAVPLMRQLDALPAAATWGEWLPSLRALAQSALRDSTSVLEMLAELEPMAPVGPIGLAELRLVLTPRLREQPQRPPRRRYGAVFVSTPAAARGLAFDVVFVPGLVEKRFPQQIFEDPILLDGVRQRLADASLPLQADRAQQERLALQLAVGAAVRELHLSYPRVDVEQARPQVPSFYALEALRAAEGYLTGFDELHRRLMQNTTSGSNRLGWPAPQRAEDAIDEAEYDLALLNGVMDADPRTVAGTAHYLLGTNPHLARALRGQYGRQGRGWTAWDGLVRPADDAAIRSALARHQLDQRSYSPTALQHYAACPYRFFLQAIQRLAPLEEVAAMEALDALTRGSMVHEILFDFHLRMRERDLLPLTPANVEAAIVELDGIVERVAADYHDKLAPAIERTWHDAVAAIRADVREWARRAAAASDGWVPTWFELSFGMAGQRRPQEDPLSQGEPVLILDRLRLRGSIDLIERHVGGQVRATDYKTGKAVSEKNIVVRGGQTLQPVFYALVCEQLKQGPVAGGRLYYCTAAGHYEERMVPLDDEARRAATAVLDAVDGALHEGHFPVWPRKDECKYCDYRPVCGSREERRVGRKREDARLEPLKAVRQLP